MPSNFVKATDNGIVVSNKPITKKTVKIDGVERQVSTQQNGLKFGFVAWENAKSLNLQVGQVLPLSLSDSKVKDQDGKELDLFWCNPD
jgi:hypothetical protein